ncbi:MAG: four helix bundle protein, partial [Clostridia bacterium]|nr:four helix bundle protein [Clostridia bacterium]
MDFAVSIINLVKSLKEKRENIISNQIGRSGTSVGANIHEAQYAHGKADFISKLQIALKVNADLFGGDAGDAFSAICCSQKSRFTSSKPSIFAIASDEKFIRHRT